MKKIYMAFGISLLLALSGCAFLEEANKGLDFKILGVSPAKGITVSVYGKTCNFSFTTDKAAIYAEVKACAFGPVVMSAPPPGPIAIGEDGELIYPEVVEEEVVLEEPKEDDPLGKIAIEIANSAENAQH